MAWGKESYDEIRSLNSNIRNIENIFSETLHQVSKDPELKFWEQAVIQVAAGIVANDGANNLIRPDWVAQVAKLVADALLEKRAEKIEEVSGVSGKDEKSI